MEYSYFKKVLDKLAATFSVINLLCTIILPVFNSGIFSDVPLLTAIRFIYIIYLLLFGTLLSVCVIVYLTSIIIFDLTRHKDKSVVLLVLCRFAMIIINVYYLIFINNVIASQ